MNEKRLLFSMLLSLGLAAACDKPPVADSSSSAARARATTPEAAAPGPAPAETPAPTPVVEVPAPGPRDPSSIPAVPRVVAIGDVHGDYEATLRVLRLAGAIDEQAQWAGGELVLVQTGDELDRGSGEQQIVDLFEALRPQARAAGGWVLALNGNHEIMNAQGDLRYVTPGGFEDFADAIDPKLVEDPRLRQAPAQARARLAAFLPGGPYARILASRNVAVIVGKTVFVHGGIRPPYAEEGLESFNRPTADWLRGEGAALPDAMTDPEGPIWTRAYSQKVDVAACDELEDALSKMGVDRMVVGHTVQAQGINPACEGKVWRIDVGLAAHYGSATAQVLEIRGDEVRVLSGEPG
jgi:hypothetical protein